jgi:ABC-type multidrug transport system ATPase subunit
MAIEACGLAHITGQTCGDLPLLENHLVAVAQAGVARPDLLVLDEPAAGLGVRAAGQVIAAIQRLRNEQQTLFIAAPVTAGLDTLCDRAIALFAGRIGEIPLIETREQSERLVVSLEEIPAELRPALLDMGFEVDEDNYRISHRGTNIQIEHSLLSALLSSNVRISRWDREPVVFPSEEE